ncbi:MAG: HipA domain-containing protein [bacterium]
MICPGCLNEKNISEGEFCNSCRSSLFERKNVSTVLSFDIQQYIHFLAASKGCYSISGVQPKITLKLFGKELKPVTTGGTYILKPKPRTYNIPKFPDDVPANEHLTMQIASQLFNINSAKNCFVRFSSGEGAYLTKRFDRNSDGGKTAQEDFCQLMNISEETHGKDYKYKFSYESAAKVIANFCSANAIEMEKFFQLVLFNYLFSNGDAHLKNFSLIQSVHSDYILSPAYDLLNTSLHFPNETRTALDLFDEIETKQYLDNGFYTGACFMKFGEVLKVRQSMALKAISSYFEKIEAVKIFVKNSMLSEVAKDDYFSRFKDRLKALSIS